MIKADVERMTHYYYGTAKVKTKSFEDFQNIEKQNNIRDIYEIFEDGFVGKWYYVIKKVGSSFAMDYGLNNVSLGIEMEQYMKKYSGKKINAEELKLYQKGIYPVVHKVDENYFYNNYNRKEKINESGYNFLYAETSEGYIANGYYNNMFLYEKFETEEDAIISLLNFYNSNKNIPKETAYRYVLDERREKDFEMIF